MNRVIGLLFTVFVALAAAFAFSARQGPPLPASVVNISNALLLDAKRAGQRLVTVGERGTIFVSDDQAASWRLIPSGSEATLTALDFFDDKVGLAVGHDALILRTEDGGLSWQTVFSAPDQLRPLLDVAFVAPGRAFAIGAYGAFLESSDGGVRWSERQIMAGDRHLNSLTRLSDGTLLIGGEAGTLLRSVDGGARWEPLSSPYAGSYFGLQSLAQGGVLAFGMRGKAFRSEDRGSSWQEINALGGGSLFGGQVLDDKKLVLVGQNGVVSLSGDQGRSFSRLPAQGGRALSAAVFLPVSGEVLVFGEGGFSRVAIATGGIK